MHHKLKANSLNRKTLNLFIESMLRLIATAITDVLIYFAQTAPNTLQFLTLSPTSAANLEPLLAPK